MATAVSTIRARLAAAIDAVSGFAESRYVYDLFGSDSRHIMHKAFAVGANQTTAKPQARARRHSGQWATTTFAVKFAVRIRADAQVADYDAALNLEEDVVQAALAMAQTNITSIELASVPSRTVSPEGEWFLGQVVFSVVHLYPTE